MRAVVKGEVRFLRGLVNLRHSVCQHVRALICLIVNNEWCGIQDPGSEAAKKGQLFPKPVDQRTQRITYTQAGPGGREVVSCFCSRASSQSRQVHIQCYFTLFCVKAAVNVLDWSFGSKS